MKTKYQSLSIILILLILVVPVMAEETTPKYLKIYSITNNQDDPDIPACHSSIDRSTSEGQQICNEFVDCAINCCPTNCVKPWEWRQDTCSSKCKDADGYDQDCYFQCFDELTNEQLTCWRGCISDAKATWTTVSEEKDESTVEPSEEMEPTLITKKIGEPFRDLTFSKGQLRMLRAGKEEIVADNVNDDVKFQAGDIIKTDKGNAEIITQDGTVKLGEETTVEFIGLEFDPVAPRVIRSAYEQYAPDPESFKYEIDDMSFWKNLWKDFVDFHKENPPEHMVSCWEAAVSCPYDTAQFIKKGAAWFDKKIKNDYPTEITITPTTAIITKGTQYSIDVADDGTTKVTTFEGSVIALDLNTREIVVVNANNQFITGEELTTIDPEKIDRWWGEEESKSEDDGPPILLLFIFGLIGIFFFILLPALFIRFIIRLFTKKK